MKACIDNSVYWLSGWLLPDLQTPSIEPYFMELYHPPGKSIRSKVELPTKGDVSAKDSFLDLQWALNGDGAPGIYDSSETADDRYGEYDCECSTRLGRPAANIPVCQVSTSVDPANRADAPCPETRISSTGSRVSAQVYRGDPKTQQGIFGRWDGADFSVLHMRQIPSSKNQ
jgi:hypothetical protein